MSNRDNDVALWAGIVAFFGSLLAIGIFDVLNPNEWLQYIGAIIVALITGGSVYAKQRYEIAKNKRQYENVAPREPTTFKRPVE